MTIWRQITRIERTRLGILVIVSAVIVGSSAAYAISPADGTSPGKAGFETLGTPDELKAQLGARLAIAGRSDLGPSPTSAFEVSREMVQGSEWLMASYKNAAGQRCIMESVPGEGRGIGCRDDHELFADGALALTWGTRQTPGGSLLLWDVAWITGLAATSLKSVQVEFTDCSVSELELRNDGSFFAVFGEDVMHGQAWPQTVRGYDAAGRAIAEREIRLESENARGAMIRGPKPSDC